MNADYHLDYVYNADYHLDYVYFENPRVYGGISIYQIGRMFANKATIVREHRHTNLYELTVVTSGAGYVSTNQVSSPVRTGDIYINMPGDLHRIESSRDDPLKFDFLAFTVHEPQFQMFEDIVQRVASPEKRIIQDERISSLVVDAIAETIGDEPYSVTVLGGIYRQIIAYLLRDIQGLSRKIAEPRHGDILCYNIMHYIDTHIYTMKGLDELSAFFGYSYGYLSAQFHHMTSRTLSDYYLERRLEEARVLLVTTRRTIAEIADQLRYSSGYALSNAFRKRFGMSPKFYRDKFNCG